MVKGKLYKVANLHKNKRNHLLVSYGHGAGEGVGWLWTTNCELGTHTFKDGDIFVSLGKKVHANCEEATHYGVKTWYEALGPKGKIHRISPATRTSYFRSP